MNCEPAAIAVMVGVVDAATTLGEAQVPAINTTVNVVTAR